MKYNKELELNLNPKFDHRFDDYDMDVDEEIEDNRQDDTKDEEQMFCRASRLNERPISISLADHLPYIIQQLEGRSW